jgi:hypothetical protein
MKIRKPLMTVLAISSLVAAASAQSVTSGDIVGYVNLVFQPGNNWVGNTLEYEYGPNTLDNLITDAPVGTTVSLWNPASNGFSSPSSWDGAEWSTDLTLDPGTGFQLNTPTLFTNTFTGTVLNLDGSVLWVTNGVAQFTEPAPFSGANGVYLLSCKSPLALGPGDQFSVFDGILGRAPQNGESVTFLNPLTQTETTTTFLDGVWSNGEPTLGIGEAALFDIGPVVVPEPSVAALLIMGACGAGLFRRQLRRGRPHPRSGKKD